MRKILISEGFGAGWTTWHSGPREERLFMLEYQPAIDLLEAAVEADVVADLGSLEERFLRDFRQAFPGRPEPYMGGFGQLQVFEVPVSSLVRVGEYDGAESVETAYDVTWL